MSRLGFVVVPGTEMARDLEWDLYHTEHVDIGPVNRGYRWRDRCGKLRHGNGSGGWQFEASAWFTEGWGRYRVVIGTV